MKASYVKLAIAITFVTFLLACSTQKKVNSSAIEWKELDDFHMLVAESFHPFMDSSNLAPAKANAVQLYEMAKKWQSAPLPDKVNTDDVKQKLEDLKKETMLLNTQVTAGNDKQLGESLTRLHDIFHELQDAWYRKE